MAERRSESSRRSRGLSRRVLTLVGLVFVIIAAIVVTVADTGRSARRPTRGRLTASRQRTVSKRVYAVRTASKHVSAIPAAPALRVISVKPTGGHVSGTSPVIIRYSGALPALARVPRPEISPSIAGSWSEPNPKTLEFRTTSAQLPYASVRVTVPAATRDAAHGKLWHPVTHRFTVKDGSSERLTQLLAQLRYLPVHYQGTGTQPVSGDRAAQRRGAFIPPNGRFSFGGGWPEKLHVLWLTDHATVLKGAVMAFESQHHLQMDGVAGREVWAALLSARLHNAMSTSGYTYAIAREASPETLTVYHDGHIVKQTVANTGAPGSGTKTGSYPVYERLRSQTMKGKNPNGTPYSDFVQFVSYFHGGDAVHYMPRASYGSPQSLGCVELPYAAAAKVWPYLTYGSLVTVGP